MEITWMIYKQSMKGNILRLKSISKRHRRKNSKLVLASQFVDSKMSDVKFFYSKFFYLKLSATYTFKLSGIKIFLNDLVVMGKRNVWLEANQPGARPARRSTART